MKKKHRYVGIRSVACFELPMDGPNTLIGYEPPSKGSRIAASGGKMVVGDNGNPDTTLLNEHGQEIGPAVITRQVAQPYYFCTRADDNHDKVKPVRGGKDVDVRFFYLKEYLTGQPQELEPNEFGKPQFVPPGFFKGKVKGVHIRTAFYIALKHFQVRKLWPLIPAYTPTVATNFLPIQRWMDKVGFHEDDIEYLTVHQPGVIKPPRPWVQED